MYVRVEVLCGKIPTTNYIQLFSKWRNIHSSIQDWAMDVWFSFCRYNPRKNQFIHNIFDKIKAFETKLNILNKHLLSHGNRNSFINTKMSSETLYNIDIFVQCLFIISFCNPRDEFWQSFRYSMGKLY